MKALAAFWIARYGAGAQTPRDRLAPVQLVPISVTAAPPHCRVAVVLTPSSDSQVGMDLRMPAADWSRRLRAVGNGGWAGSVEMTVIARQLIEAHYGRPARQAYWNSCLQRRPGALTGRQGARAKMP